MLRKSMPKSANTFGSDKFLEYASTVKEMTGLEYVCIDNNATFFTTDGCQIPYLRDPKHHNEKVTHQSLAILTCAVCAPKNWTF